MPEQDTAGPLKSAHFHILLVLASEDRHGLGIAKAVDETTDGVMRLGPGTLYRALKELTASGWVEPTVAPQGEDDPRRQFYAITPAGRAAVMTEAGRLARLVDAARAQALLPEDAS